MIELLRWCTQKVPTISADDVRFTVKALALEDFELLPTTLRNPSSRISMRRLWSSLECIVKSHDVFAKCADAFMAHGIEGIQRIVARLGSGSSAKELSFPTILRRFISAVYVLTELLRMSHESFRSTVDYYENLLESYGGHTFDKAPSPSNLFMDIKGESVLAAINSMNRVFGQQGDIIYESDVARDIFRINILEATLADLLYYNEPENARAGVALIAVAPGQMRTDATQDLAYDWYSLYVTWNACFCWRFDDGNMLLFAKLLAPSVSCGSPRMFTYKRAYTLFWVVRAQQIRHFRNQWSKLTWIAPDYLHTLHKRMARWNAEEGIALGKRERIDLRGSVKRLVFERTLPLLSRIHHIYVREPKRKRHKKDSKKFEHEWHAPIRALQR